MTDFLSAENLRESVFAECSAYLTTMISYVVTTAQGKGDKFQLDVDALFLLFSEQPQNEHMALPIYARNLFYLVVCFNFGTYYDVANAATQGQEIYPDSLLVGIKKKDISSTAKKILGNKKSLSFISSLTASIAMFENHGVLNKITESASEFKEGASGHVTYIQLTPDFIRYFYNYVQGLRQHDSRTEEKQG